MYFNMLYYNRTYQSAPICSISPPSLAAIVRVHSLAGSHQSPRTITDSESGHDCPTTGWSNRYVTPSETEQSPACRFGSGSCPINGTHETASNTAPSQKSSCTKSGRSCSRPTTPHRSAFDHVRPLSLSQIPRCAARSPHC